MQGRKFKLSHSFWGTISLLIIEGLILRFISVSAGVWLVLVFSVIGALMNIYSAMEAIEEVKSSRHMLVFLSILAALFIVLFAFQYWFLIAIEPASFASLAPEPISLLLASIMAFVFNPLYLPGTLGGEGLLVINTLASITLVLFILQNITQFRHRQQNVSP
ncbi:MAG TPA: hypothetical protein VFK07_03300 [Candidatus Paceibacterota bacterium]|nr:hypothetical protein [Candidatus Paceibacterota bacterium]